MSQKSLKDALRKAVARITATKSWPAIIIGEGSHPTRSLVQLSNGVEMEVLNTATMALAGQHVRIGYSPTNPGEMQVLGIIGSASILNRLYLYNYTIGSHHKNHEAPNPDMVYVYGMAFLPDGVMPYRGLSVIVHGEVAWDGSDWKTPARRVVNLSTHVPGAGCRYVLLEADGEDVIVTDGSIVASTSLLTLDKLPRPTAGRKPLAGVALQAGQTDIMQDVRVGKRNDILDLRWTGGAGANWSDIDSATADTPLDADKFPFWDVVDSALKSVTWTNVKATLKTYFDTLYSAISHNHDSSYAPTAKGVTNGDSHDHNGGDGAQIAHGNLSSIGTNTHAQVDAHIASVANPHNVTAVQAGAQPVDAGLTSLSAFPTVADRIVYSTAADTWAETPLTAAARTLLDDATVAAMRTTLNAAGLADANDFTATQTVKVADNTKAIVLTDDSDVEWLSIKRVGNTVTLDVPSVEPVNKLINPTFDTDLSSWSEIMSYILNDQFTTDRAAGAVNGTSAEPTGGTRTVTDTTNKLSISSGQLSFVNSGINANPGIWYPSLSRGAGKIITGTINVTANSMAQFGFNNATSNNPQTCFYIVGTTLQAVDSSGIGVLATLTAGTSYQYSLVLRSTGVYFYIKGGTEFTNWTLLGIAATTNTATLYPNLSIHSGATDTFIADNIRIPTSTWLPTPLAYDTFTRADGAIGSSETTGPDSQTTPSLAWTGGAISSNKNVITPTLGSELVTNGGFDSDTAWTKGAGWTIGSGVATHTGANYSMLEQTIGTVGKWYQMTYTITARTSGDVNARFGTTNGTIVSTPATYTNSARQISGTNIGLQSQVFEGSVDDVSTKELTLSSLFSTVSTSDSDVIADANVTLTAGTQAGLVLNLDSTSSPANFLIAYHDGTNVKLDKNVGGTYTSLINTAVTYSAGATLRVITYHSDANTLKVRVYYNNALVGSEQTVTDAGIISNTKHGLFSTYSGNSFDNFSLFARGTGAEYTSAPFEELTVTRDTTTKYAGAASAKLVAGGTDANYLQSVNVGDTATYNLYCYAYTTGAAVTSADVELYYDGAVLSTSYTDMGGGWYKLSSSLTGVASAKDFGVRVKAGKTVYCDSFSLQAGSGATTILKILNGGTGLLLLQLADGLPEYADNAAAVAAGLAVGVTYRTGDVVKIVH